MGDSSEWEDLNETIAKDIKQTKPNKVTNDPEFNHLPNRHVYTRKVDGVKRRVVMYSSPYVSGFAVNAIDNTPFNIRIGSVAEQYLFSVRFTSDRIKGKEPDIITLYYESPYGYEKHHGTLLNPAVISEWYSKFNKLPIRPIYSHIQPDPPRVLGVVVK